AKLLVEQIHEFNIGGLVLGWPLNMDGTESPRCDSIRDFAHAFLRLHEVPITFQDERLSTKAVERGMIAADMTRAKRAIRRDSLAAVWILQSALDTYDHQ
ncbi:MAG: Holliday junction resolvase RuvX, partial [Alphaproteobacteria bacterium]|nr:Holliday junction resolvase RuvX [Alphaproteobacteria bacterium]